LMLAAQEFSNPVSAAFLIGFALVFALLTWMNLRGLRRPVRRRGAPSRSWAAISAFMALACLALAVIALIEEPGS